MADQPVRMLAEPRNPWDGSEGHATHGRGGGGEEINEARTKTADGRQDPEVIKSIKVAAAELGTAASLILETAARIARENGSGR
jgi:hypothetical protein